jgi:hypothetical protein
MQALEASLSFLVFVSMASVLMVPEESGHIDDSLHRAHLAEDAWRVLYLRGALENMSRPELEAELSLIEAETGFCIFIDGVVYTNCRGPAAAHHITASLQKTVVVNGAPRRLTFSIGR